MGCATTNLTALLARWPFRSSTASSPLRQAQGERVVAASQVRSNALGFIPLGTTSAAQEQRNATEAMIRSAASPLFDTAVGALPMTVVALGAAAVQWPTVAGAAGRDGGSGADAGIAGQSRNNGGGDDSRGVGSAADSAMFVSSLTSSSSPIQTLSNSGNSGSSNLQQNSSNSVISSQFEASNQVLAQQIRARAASETIAFIKPAKYLTTHISPCRRSIEMSPTNGHLSLESNGVAKVTAANDNYWERVA